MRRLAGLLTLVAFAASPAAAWDYWGGDAGGTRFSKLDQITPANVDRLVRAWDYRTGDLASRPPEAMKRTKFEATPLLVEDSLMVCSAFNEVIALDPGTGEQKWRFDPASATRSVRATASTAAAWRIGWMIARPTARPAAAASMWVPTTPA